jgi:GNAT superfamily N-acetyltransferase
MDISIERVFAPTPQVRALLSELDEVLGAAYPPDQRHALSLDQLFQQHVRFFVARITYAAVGCGGVAFPGGFAEVKRMYMRPSVRGRGVGKALLAHIEAEARAVGVPVLRLETGTYQTEAVGLYERCGFCRCIPFGHYADLPPHRIEASLFYEKQL